MDPQPRGPDWMPITPKTGSLFHAGSQIYLTAYVLIAQRHSMWLSISVAFIMWLAAVLVLSPVQWAAWSASTLNVIVFTACTFIVQPFCFVRIPRTTRPWYDFVLRAGLVASLVGVVVTLSFQIGPTGSGVLAVFPVIYTSIMLILHRRVGGPATEPCWRTPFPLLPDLVWLCSPCISPQCRLDPVQPSSSPSAFPSFGMPLFTQYVAAKLLLNYLARPGRLSNAG